MRACDSCCRKVLVSNSFWHGIPLKCSEWYQRTAGAGAGALCQASSPPRSPRDEALGSRPGTAGLAVVKGRAFLGCWEGRGFSAITDEHVTFLEDGPLLAEAPRRQPGQPWPGQPWLLGSKIVDSGLRMGCRLSKIILCYQV